MLMLWLIDCLAVNPICQTNVVKVSVGSGSVFSLISPLADCGPPTSVINAEIIEKVLNGTIFGAKVSYLCSNGYEMHGPRYSRCNTDGEWTTPPTCESMAKYLKVHPFVESSVFREKKSSFHMKI